MSKKYYRVVGWESGYLGEYDTLKEAEEAIKSVKEFDMRVLGHTDAFSIETYEEAMTVNEGEIVRL